MLDQKPRKRFEGVLSRLLWERTVIAGLVMGVGTLAVFRWELDRTDSLVAAQTAALTTMVLFQVFHVGNSRSSHLSVVQKSPRSNPFLLIATISALSVHIAALYLPPTQYILRVEPLELDVWVRMIALAATVIVAVELHKLLRKGSVQEGRNTSPLLDS
jgi:Ca2+-transporting ATPase